MRVEESRIELIDKISANYAIQKIELALRNCYKSENNIKEGSAEQLIRNCITRGHLSPLEHCNVTYRVVCDRGVSHEWVRHRMASYSQESTRYCNYGKDKFGNELTFIAPVCEDEEFISKWEQACLESEAAYLGLINSGAKPDFARSVLNNSIKTDIICTMNLREIRHFLDLRTSNAAHPDIRKLARQLAKELEGVGLGIFFEGCIH